MCATKIKEKRQKRTADIWREAQAKQKKNKSEMKGGQAKDGSGGGCPSPKTHPTPKNPKKKKNNTKARKKSKTPKHKPLPNPPNKKHRNHPTKTPKQKRVQLKKKTENKGGSGTTQGAGVNKKASRTGRKNPHKGGFAKETAVTNHPGLLGLKAGAEKGASVNGLEMGHYTRRNHPIDNKPKSKGRTITAGGNAWCKRVDSLGGE